MQKCLGVSRDDRKFNERLLMIGKKKCFFEYLARQN